MAMINQNVGIKFLDDFGNRVDGDIHLNYLVVQSNEVDNVSSYRLQISSQNLPYQVDI